MSAVPEGIVEGPDGVRRCWWAAEPPIYQEYHDREWGMPLTSDHRLFEKICLEGFQSGLSWLTVLKKREAFREVFCGFDFNQVAWFAAGEIAVMLADPRIIRHRGKIESTINNARRAIEMIAEFGSLSSYFWGWEPKAGQRPENPDRATVSATTRTPESSAMSNDLRKRGWTFVGPTTCHAFMQAVGIVNDHVCGCPARERAAAARKALPECPGIRCGPGHG